MLELNARGRLASARGRRRPLRRVAREQRGLGALARPLLGHAAAGLGLRPRPVARRGDRQLRRAAPSSWGRPLPGGLRPAQAVHRRVHLGRAACGGTMRRAPEVIDTWFDSGLDAVRPVALSVRAPGRVRARTSRPTSSARGWTRPAAGSTRCWPSPPTAFDSPAYRNVIVNELVLDAEGQKMSKSQGQRRRSRGTMIEEFGADTVRLYLLASSQVWLPKRFDARHHPRGGGRVPQHAAEQLRVLRRCTPATGRRRRRRAAAERPLVDRWLLSRLDATVDDGGRGLGRLRRHRRRPRDHGLRGGRPVELVRAAQPGALLGARSATPIRRRSRRCTRRWSRSAGCWRRPRRS